MYQRVATADDGSGRERSAVPGLRYTCSYHWDVWFWGPLTVLLVVGYAGIAIMELVFDGIAVSGSLLFIGVLLGLVLFAVTPRRLEIWHDRLSSRFWGGFAVSLPYHDIILAEPNDGKRPEGTCPMPTSASGRVLIRRRTGCIDFTISPADRSAFMVELNAALVAFETPGTSLDLV